jgi:Carboxypeptidase regulatory-like domain/TonB dependent receptor
MRSQFFLIVVLVLAFSLYAAAQVTTADVVGRVTDTSGAVLPGVMVVIENLGTGASRSAVSSDSGDYVFNLLPPGRYSARFELPGFKTFTVANVMLAAGDRARINAQMTVGAVSESVNVEEQAPLLQTDSATLGTAITGRLVQDLPLNGRNYVQLTQLVTGVSSGPGNGLATGSRPDDRRLNSSYSVNGQDPVANNNLIDGMDNNERFIGTIGIRPSIDAIEEFKVQTNLYSAEVSRTAAGVVNILTKSGTNTFHGSLFEFLRNDALDANGNYNLTGTQLPKAKFRQNQFGGSLGGPVKKDKTFFFGDYERLSIRQGIPIDAIIPTARQRRGDLGENCTSVGGSFDPSGNCSVPSGQLNVAVPIPGIPSGAVPFNDLTRAPYAGALDPVGLKYASLYPLPTSGLVNKSNFVTSPVRPQDAHTFDVRIDHHFSDKTTFFSRYSFNDVSTFQPTGFPDTTVNSVALNPGGNFTASNFSGSNATRAQNVLLNLVHIFRPNLLVELKAGAARTAIQSRAVNDGLSVASALGFPCNAVSCVNLGDDQTFGIPRIIFGGNQYQGLGDVSFVPLLQFDNTYQYSGAVTWTRSAHNVKFGTSLIFRQFSLVQSPSARGEFTFNADASNARSTTNDALANVLFGTPTIVGRRASLYKPGYRAKEAGFYIQDDWRARGWLTLNLGIRYDLFPPKTEQYGRMANFDPYTLKTLVPGVNGVGDTAGIIADYKTVAPRIGFAATLGDGFVVRGGWGLSYFPTDYTSGVALRNLPIASVFACGTGAGNPCPAGIGFLSQGVPRPTSPDAYAKLPDGTLDLTQIPPAQLQAVDRNYRIGHTQQFNVLIEKQFGNSVISAGYVGMRGANLAQALVDINRGLPTGTSATSPRLFSAFPLIGQVGYYTSHGNSEYNALQINFNRRLSNGLSFTSGYTEARSHDNVTGLGTGTGGYSNSIGPLPGAFDRINRYDWANSDFNIPRRFTFGGNYDLPFGRNLKGVAGAAFANWRVNGSMAWQKGLPLTVVDSAARSGIAGVGGSVERPDLTGQPLLVSNPTVGSTGQYLNPAAFALPAVGTLGNAPRNLTFGPNQNVINLSLFKTFTFTERSNLQFRAEAFNLPNHPVFDRPAFNNFGTAAFGKITGLAPGYSMRQLQFALKLLF